MQDAPKNLVTELDYVRIDHRLIEKAVDALAAAKALGFSIVAAESCTGGLIATVLSEAPGAAEHFAGSFVVYTPQQKCAALDLDPGLVEEHGTVSMEVAKSLAESALRCSEADIAVAVTGVAGPDADEKGNPVGLVYLAGTRRDATIVLERNYGNIGRSKIRYNATLAALALIKALANGSAQSSVRRKR